MRTLIAVLSILAVVAPAAAERFDDPVELVEFVYSHYADGSVTEFDENDLWSPRLSELTAIDDARGELGSLTFDPFINSQEDYLTGLDIEPISIGDSAVVVAVAFDNGGGTQTSNFTLVPTADGWKIDEIEGVTPGREWKLSDILAAPL